MDCYYSELLTQFTITQFTKRKKKEEKKKNEKKNPRTKYKAPNIKNLLEHLPTVAQYFRNQEGGRRNRDGYCVITSTKLYNVR